MTDPGDIRAGFESFYRQKWTGHDGFWLEWYPPYLGLYADLLRQRNAAIAGALPGTLDAALDCGCGAGDVSALLAARARRVVSFDVAQANAVQARRNLERAVGAALVARAAAEDLPFADASFDAVVLADVIEHIPDRRRAVAEFARVLRPGGRLIMATPDRQVLHAIEKLDHLAMLGVQSMRNLVRRAQGRPVTPRQVTGDQWEEFISRDELAALVGDAGFTIHEHRNICFYPGPEGGGTFAFLLSLLRDRDQLRERVVEPALRRVFAVIEAMEVLNQKQLIVGVKRAAAEKKAS